ncbi:MULTISPECIES: sporulation membrane protein YtaF [Bacillus]|uniref:sporulation membrane protein YtaF n=1 Tax=Bacillus TaxID=1386 RepID=UPI0002D9FCAB|nr:MULTISPECIES: sporulation membrane protein YtaF [Bacillus]
MSNFMALILLAFAVSLDSFSVGFTYGLRKMKIPFKSTMIIGCLSAATILVSMLIGEVLSNFLSPSFTARIGGMILILLGIWVTFQTFRSKDDDIIDFQERGEKVIATIEMKYFGIAINILKKPMAADIDRSGVISGKEALILGAALSFDAFGAGLGAAMLGYSPILLAGCIGIMSSLFIKMGMLFGNKLSYQRWINKLTLLPGILLILIGILKW